MSALIHLWLAWIALGLVWGLRMASYFLIEAVLVRVEAAMRVERWPDWAARTWTLSAVLLPLAIGVDMFLLVFGL